MARDVDGFAVDAGLNTFADAAEEREDEDEEEESESANGGHHGHYGHHDRNGDDDGAGGPGGSGVNGGADSSVYALASGYSSNGSASGAEDKKFDKTGGGHFDSVLEFHFSIAMYRGREVISDIEKYPAPVMLQKIAEFTELPGLSSAPSPFWYQPHLSVVGVVDKSCALCS